MQLYVAVLTVAAFVAAVCAGFILASSPRQRATQLAASLAAGASWWALCEARWNAAGDPGVALLWMRLSAPGWCFLGGIVPHLMARYLDLYPASQNHHRTRLLRFAGFGYAVGTVTLVLAALGLGVHGAVLRVPWGWTYEPGPVLPAYLLLIAPGILYTVVSMLGHMHSPVSVAPRAHRISIRTGIMLPVVLTPLTDVILPVAGVHFPRLGSTSYALFGLVALGTGLRYGMTFFTPKQFSEEILEAIHEGVAMITPTGLIRRANPGLARLVGQPAHLLVGVPLEEILDGSLPAQPGAVEERQARLTDARGEQITVSVSATPLHDRHGNALGLVVVVRDLREIEELRRHMLIQARLAAVGELVAGLAHEINNPLAFVRSNLAMLERHAKLLADPDAVSAAERDELAQESRELVEESLVGVDRAAEIVRGVRRFTHAGSSNREPANLNELLEDAVAMLRPRVRSREIALELRPRPLPSVLCAPQEMRQVFLNLLVNALDAVGDRGQVRAETRVAEDALVVEIRDDGCGMEPDTLERIFDPFFTTKSVGEGTGLGLGIAWNIVRAQGGQIEVRSQPGVGSTFRVQLPVAPDADVFAAAGEAI
jgi:PAS domain S-box-containing protein